MNQPDNTLPLQTHTNFVWFYPFVFTGKERDEETGYGYFGARYMDHELMTGWLSVDPMSDKYPSISPYAYCAWNPVKLVDPDGMAVRAADKQSQMNIMHSLSKAEARYVRFDKNGNIDLKRLNKCKSNSINFNALRTLARSKTEYIFSSETRHKDKNNDIDLSEPYNPIATRGVTLIPGNIEDPSPDNNVYVITSSNLSDRDQVENVAHEGYGHAYFYELSKQGNGVNPYHEREQTYILEYDEEYKCIVPTLIWIEKNTRLKQQIEAAIQEVRKNYKSWTE